MSRRIKAFLLAASVAGAMPVVAQPASADWLFGGCAYAAFADPTDPQGETWIEFTYSAFVGTPDVSSFEVTCWLQTDEDLNQTTLTDSTAADTTSAASWGNPSASGELANTRHTCSAAGAGNACANPVVFQTAETVYYQCQHVTWTDGGAVASPFDLIDHVLRDVFSTGGVTTMGGANQIVATVTLAVTNVVATLQSGGTPTTHTEWSDYKPLDDPDVDFRKDGLQCSPSDV